MIFGTDAGFDVKIIVTYNEIKARELLDDCRLYCRESYFYPAKDLIFYQADVHGNQLVTERIKCLRRMLEGMGACAGGLDELMMLDSGVVHHG